MDTDASHTADLDAEERLRRALEPGSELEGDTTPRPRIGLFLFDATAPDVLRITLHLIPKSVEPWIHEVLIMQDPPPAPELPPARDLVEGRSFRLGVHRSPRDYGYGGARKAAFEYAARSRLDYAIAMRGDGVHPPEALPRLLAPLVDGGEGFVLASRLAKGAPDTRARLGTGRWLAHRLAGGIQNRVLGLRVRDYGSGFRIYPVSALECVPYQLDSNDRRFDVEIVIQLRALGLLPHEVPVESGWREGGAEGGTRPGVAHVARAVAASVDYRAHQLHLTRRGRYLVDHGIHYTLKHSETGSHMQIVRAIAPDSRVLDLGCSQGLLARPLLDKTVRVTGVDAAPGEQLAKELETYHRRDLEEPLQLPEGRVFDTVVVADVIEHLRNRQELLRSARRHLRADGRMLISTPNIALWFYRLSLLVGRFEYGPRGVLDRTHVHLYTRATFRREVERAGFHIVRERVTALPFEVVFQSTGRSRAVAALARAYHALARAWPEMFAYQFILEAEITTLDRDAVAGADRGRE